MSTNLSQILHTGTTRAFFIPSIPSIRIEKAIAIYGADDIKMVSKKNQMAKLAPAGTVIPEEAAYQQPESKYGKSRMSKKFVMFLSDREPEALLAAFTEIGLGHDTNVIAAEEKELAGALAE